MMLNKPDTISLKETIFKKAANIQTKEIDGELMISVRTDHEEPSEFTAIYRLSQTGCVIWECIDGKASLNQIIKCLSKKYDAPVQRIEKDVLNVIQIFFNKSLIWKV